LLSVSDRMGTMTINVTNRDTGKPVLCGDTIIGNYGDEWIFLALTAPTMLWVRDPITGKVHDLDPMVMNIDISIRG